MNAPSAKNEPPRKILLATDLSPRCDRALDRAAALAAQWKSELVVLHVLERVEPGVVDAIQPTWRRPVDPASLARRRLAADVNAVADNAAVLVREGDPAAEILRTCEAFGCELVVIGPPRSELLGRLPPGGTVDRVLRRAGVPLLVVKDRPRGPYRHIVAATDFSAPSRLAVEAAARFFPEQKLTVFHAYEAHMPRLLADPTMYRRDYLKAAALECEAFLESVDKPPAWQRPHVLIEDGSPIWLLSDYVRESDADLIVLGTQGRGAVREILLGSVAKAIMAETSCDALIVRESRAAMAMSGSMPLVPWNAIAGR